MTAEGTTTRAAQPRMHVLPHPGRCAVMGILNVTPDSFSDGGLFHSTSHAVTHGLLLAAQGADIVDVGGESTRPHADRVPADEELRRVLPVVQELASAGVTVSVDTMRARVAEAAVSAGAAMVNDVSGGLADPAMAEVVAASGVTYVAMHWRAHSTEMARHATYGEVVTEVTAELGARLDALTDAGVSPDQIVLDPGIGFAKTAAHNWALLSRIDTLQCLGRPVLVGASRKSFLGHLLAQGTEPPPPQNRDAASLAVSTIAAARGVDCVRVHEVRATVDAVRVASAWRAAEANDHDQRA